MEDICDLRKREKDKSKTTFHSNEKREIIIYPYKRGQI